MPQARRPIEADWFDFQEKVLAPAKVGPIQMQESRRVFYAGAMSLWAAIHKALGLGSALEELASLDEIQADFDTHLAELWREMDEAERGRSG